MVKRIDISISEDIHDLLKQKAEIEGLKVNAYVKMNTYRLAKA